jgi:hypothetical protein
MPDIDVDFCINGRERVIKYVVERYGGGDYVAQIITFGKMKTKLVIRDVGRALDIPLAEVDTIAKLIPDVLKITLTRPWSRKNPSWRRWWNRTRRIAELIDICRSLEGFSRHASTHAAGVVIGDRPWWSTCPCTKGRKGSGHPVRHEKSRKDRAGQIRFSGVAKPDRHRSRLKSHRPPGQAPRTFGKIDLPFDGLNLRSAAKRGHHRCVSAGKFRYEKPVGAFASRIF